MASNTRLPQRARRVLRSIRQALPSGVILGRKSAGEGPAEFIPLEEAVTTILDGLPNSVRGAVIFRGANGWSALAPGTADQSLQTQGAGADPIWADREAANVTYDNSDGELTSDNVKDALDEISTNFVAGFVVADDGSGGIELVAGGDGDFIRTTL